MEIMLANRLHWRVHSFLKYCEMIRADDGLILLSDIFIVKNITQKSISILCWGRVTIPHITGNEFYLSQLFFLQEVYYLEY